jgi:hypothetical protein
MLLLHTFFLVKPYFNRILTVLKRLKYGLNTTEIGVWYIYEGVRSEWNSKGGLQIVPALPVSDLKGLNVKAQGETL